MAAPFHGPRAGVRSANVTANTALNSDDKVCQVLTPDSAWTVNITPVPRAGFGFMIRNAATVPGRTLALTDYADNAIVTLDAGEVYQVIGNGSAFIPFALSESTVVDLTLSDALTAAGDLINGTLTINHATATVEGIDLTVSAITTARTGGEVVHTKATLVGLAGDTSGATYVGTDYNATPNGGSAVFVAQKMDAGWSAWADLSECATGEADIIVGDNLASALQIREAANVHWTFVTTNSAEGLRAEDNISLYVGTGGDLRVYHNATDTFINSILGTAKLRIGLPNTDGTSAFYLEQTGANPLLTVTSDAVWAAYIKDNSGTAWRVIQAGNNYLAIDTTDGTETVALGNATTNPVYSFLGTGVATFTGGLGTDTIAERSSAAGVTIDGVTLKDDGILSLVLADHADDAAAAGGGIAVGQLYRTSSAVKVRVA